VAQVDTGYSDTTYPPSLNINRALFEQLRRSGVILRPDPSADQALSTCVAGEQEQVRAYRLPEGLAVDPSSQGLWFRGPPPASR
jgi:hypothetical protein